jgi:CO dehydrogenase maturation factor
MTLRIAVAGKGGTGKTTLAALIVHHLVERGHKPVLAIDADPNSCLGAALGATACDTIGGIREELMRTKDELPAGISKAQYIEMKVRSTMGEEEGFDLLVMGRPEGTGCYCYVNSVLRSFMDNLGEGYPYVVMDNEAGLEHLSRRTTQGIDVMFLVSDPSKVGIESAARVRDLAKEMDLRVGAFHLVVNRATDAAAVADVAARSGFTTYESIPPDPRVEQAALTGQAVASLGMDSAAVRTVLDIVRKHVPGA